MRDARGGAVTRAKFVGILDAPEQLLEKGAD